jgi:hypothetical protein
VPVFPDHFPPIAPNWTWIFSPYFLFLQNPLHFIEEGWFRCDGSWARDAQEMGWSTPENGRSLCTSQPKRTVTWREEELAILSCWPETDITSLTQWTTGLCRNIF